MKGMSFAEKAKLYAALADLEAKHGKEIVRELIVGMLDNSEPKLKEGDTVTIIHETLGINHDYQVGETKGDQMELFPAKKRQNKRQHEYRGRKRAGENHKRIIEWADEHDPNVPPSETLLRMYYKDGLTQDMIGEKIGVNQRAISEFLSKIPEKFKREVIAGWNE